MGDKFERPNNTKQTHFHLQMYNIYYKTYCYK